jgi:hypothetical protein
MKIYVIISEKSTGKVLHQDGSRYQTGEADYRVKFDGADEARVFCKEYSAVHSDRELVLVDEQGECV